MERRYDIDWLRVIAIGLLLIYHIGIAFQPWGTLVGFIQTDQTLTWLWTPMSMLNVWRIPFLFFVSGMGVAFSFRKRTLVQLLIERAKRILLPFVFGVFCIVPLHIYLFQAYYDLPADYVPNPGHLWFLGNIAIYLSCLFPVFLFLQSDRPLAHALQRIFSSPLGLLLMIIATIAEVLLVQPQIFSLYAQTLHGFFIGLVAFFFGYCSLLDSTAFGTTLRRFRWYMLSLAAVLYGIRIYVYHLTSPNVLMATESCLWIFSVLAFGQHYLNRPSRALTYLSEAAYPVYILHMIFLYLGSLWIFAWDIPGLAQWSLLTAFTFVGSFVSFAIIHRINILRPLFGLKPKKRSSSHQANN
ncbi:acyltransferase [Reichenbachiella sp. 5M10]|uniref:acyltransferase family protein n=1 Tax=Reichenbachiella sp. 5M10 TaxID=1889772 RepID=UPI000C156F26|nr:acyltransferase family protein [Reichenbachiella sp. 5M10]PIB35969.1 acyltransferase [Reichenbachiella sp. 5M10]